MIYRAKLYGVLLLIFTLVRTQASEKPQILHGYHFGEDNTEHLTISGFITPEDAEQIFNSAPQAIKNIVSHLKDPGFLNKSTYRYVIFVGEPGTGKTETAKAVAYKMEQHGWKTLYITSGDVVGDKRNQTVVHLREELKNAQASRKPLIVLIDELNELLEHSENDHYDSSTTSKFLWGFLDSQRNNPHFFMIGTMNRDTKLPQPFKSRITTSRIEFHAPTDPATNRIKFHSYLVNGGVKLENEVDQQFLSEIIKKCTDCSFRDLEMIALKSKLIYREHDHDSNNITLGKVHIEQAIKEHHNAKIAMNYYDKEESESERQERYFVQRLIIENLIRQCQETHYEYASIGSDLRVNKTWQTMSPECIAGLEALFSNTQQMLAGAFNNRSEKAKDDKKRELEELKELEKKTYEKLPWYKRWVTKEPKK
ncbi:MAG: AAA family ATPase [Candidatus Dependentiae bacterium]|nr:AAA family ATPase [Candidatus Dependentiae bacterium]